MAGFSGEHPPDKPEAAMDLAKIPIGRNPPAEINAVIEISQGGPVKYELDPDSGALFVDRFLPTAMHYPGNYGFVPHTLAEDGDPIDVLVLTPDPVLPGAVVRCRPVGALLMEDEHGPDEKIIALPIDTGHRFDVTLVSHTDLPAGLRDQIAHFFTHYKDLDRGKWVKVHSWVGADEAAELVDAAIARAKARDKAG
jgi:inorganic pyrophosphatase